LRGRLLEIEKIMDIEDSQNHLIRDYDKMMSLYLENENSPELNLLAEEYKQKYGEEKLKDFWRESDGF
jgi:hypothetical protein